MFLNEITSSVTDVTNCDNDMISRLVKLPIKIPYTPDQAMDMDKIITEAVRESNWQDKIISPTGELISNPRNKNMITEFFEKIWL